MHQLVFSNKRADDLVYYNTADKRSQQLKKNNEISSKISKSHLSNM